MCGHNCIIEETKQSTLNWLTWLVEDSFRFQFEHEIYIDNRILSFPVSQRRRKASNATTPLYLKGLWSAARSSAYFPLDMISLLKPIFSYSFPRLNLPTSKITNINNFLHKPNYIVFKSQGKV
jgi:hypothetical protein